MIVLPNLLLMSWNKTKNKTYKPTTQIPKRCAWGFFVGQLIVMAAVKNKVDAR